MTRIVAAVAALFLVAGCVQTTKPDAPGDVQSACYQNFVVEGTPGISNVNYRSWREFPGLTDQQRALNNLRSAMMAEGFSNIGVDASAGALTAVQAHSIPSRAPTLRVSARKVGAGIRVDAIFMILQGQTSDSTIVRRNLCRIVDAANL
jgi:hypothetical protein